MPKPTEQTIAWARPYGVPGASLVS
jgi:hypothetical protein